MQQAVPQKIKEVSVKLRETCNLLSEKLGQEVETEIQGLNNLLVQQDQVNLSTIFSTTFDFFLMSIYLSYIPLIFASLSTHFTLS